MGRWVSVCLVLVACGAVAPAAELTVFTKTGQRLHGEVDRQSDVRWLWLRTTVPGITLRSKTAWTQVTSVIADGRELSPEETLRLGEDPRSRVEWPDGPAALEVAPREVLVPCVHCAPPRLIVPRVETIETRAVVANWDEDPQPDGLEVEVRPTAWGQSVPAGRGAVSVRLYGEPIQDSSRIRILRRHERATELGRWSVPVHEWDFAQGTAIVRLPFQQIDPFEGRRFSPVGYALISLGVNGQGTFRANTPVVLRDPWEFDAFEPFAQR